MRRVHEVGTSGAGKSTLARQLAAAIDVPYAANSRLRFVQLKNRRAARGFLKTAAAAAPARPAESR